MFSLRKRGNPLSFRICVFKENRENHIFRIFLLHSKTQSRRCQIRKRCFPFPSISFWECSNNCFEKILLTRFPQGHPVAFGLIQILSICGMGTARGDSQISFKGVITKGDLVYRQYCLLPGAKHLLKIISSSFKSLALSNFACDFHILLTSIRERLANSRFTRVECRACLHI